MSVRAHAVTVLLAAVLCGGCRLEKRPDAPKNEVPLEATGAMGPVADSAEAVLGEMAAALAAGDVARVRQLTTADAVLIDQDEQVHWTRRDSASALPSVMRAGAGDPDWRLLDSSYARLGPEAALFSLRFQSSEAVDTIPQTAMESWVMVRTAGSWKVQYLHRSRGLTGTASRR